MSEDQRKHIRTQGKYSELGKTKSRDKRHKISPAAKEPPEKKHNNRYSNGSRGSNNSFIDENISPIKYEENSEYSFEQLEETKRPTEIDKPGKYIISTTVNGDSVVIYEPEFLGEEEGDEYFNRLYDSTKWSSKNIVINGEEKPQPRLVAWYGPFPYSYSGATLEPAEMPNCVLEIKKEVETHLNKIGMDAKFNSVLLNLYRSGKDSVAWHSDDELTMGIYPTIASVSLGAVRKFEMRPIKKYSEDDSFREKQGEFFVYLTHGSLLIMDGCMQEDWQHRVPKEYHDKGIRINLTFRTVYPLEKVSYKTSGRESKKKSMENLNSNKTSSLQTSLNDADFPPLSSSEDFPPASSDENFPPLNSDENFPPLNSDENFPPLSIDINPSFVHPCSGVGSDFHDMASSSSSRNDDSNRSYENWDCETSFDEKLTIENDIPSYNSYDSSFTTNHVKSAERNMDVTDRAFEMNSVEKQIRDSKECPSVSENYNEEPPKKSLNVLAKEFIPNFKPVFQTLDYSKFSLKDLSSYQIELMCDAELQSFSSNLKDRVTEKLPEFSRFFREELEFLCNLTDGTQSEKNQKLITSRMLNLISNSLQNHHSSQDVQKSYDRPPRSQSYVRQNYYTDRGRRHQHYNNPGRSKYM